MSENEMIHQLENLIEHIDVLISEELARAKENYISPHRMRNTNGELALAPLLVAKAQVYSALIPLKFPRS